MIELALRESETRLRDLALTTADWLWEVDASGRYTSCSDRVTDVLGYAPDEIIGRTPFDLMVEEDALAIAPVFERLVREHAGCTELKHRNRHKDGHEVVLLTSCVPDAQRRRRAARLPRRGQGHHPARGHGALAAPAHARARGAARGRARHRGDDRLRRRPAPRRPRGRRGARDGRSASSGSTRPTAISPCSAASGSASPRPAWPPGSVGSSYPIRTHAGGLDGLRAGVVVQQSRSDPDLQPPMPRTWTGGARRRGSPSRWCSSGRAARRDDPHRDRRRAPLRRRRGPHGRGDRRAGGGGAAQRAPPPPRRGAQPLAALAGERRAGDLGGAGPRHHPERGGAARGRGGAGAGRVHLRVRARAGRPRHARPPPGPAHATHRRRSTPSSRSRPTPQDRRALDRGRGPRGDAVRPDAAGGGARAHGGVRRADAAQRAAALAGRDRSACWCSSRTSASASSPTRSWTSWPPSASRSRWS